MKWRRAAGAIALALVAPATTLAADDVARPSAMTAEQTGGPTTASESADIERSQSELIHRLVALTDSPQMRAVFSEQLVDRVSSAISMFGPTLNERTLNIVQQQTRTVVAEHIADGDALYSVLAPIYQKHFNLVELNQLVTFYQSPLGQKLVRVSPELLTETLDLGSQWGLSLVPEIVDRVQARLDQHSGAATDTAP
ncbi:DUF2059 domain-containing protein [Salinisphaera sp. SPP-AMP-43]|uniref:DUF2059 domain-containing protein n=1 Tax=Salinisphaera sp. SPP-AMP-43 TaxID=3121288 RepID=UPI003C6E50FA